MGGNGEGAEEVLASSEALAFLLNISTTMLPKRDQPVFWPSGEVILRGKWTGAAWMRRIGAMQEQLPRSPFEP